MKVELNIDETQFKELLEGQLSKLPEDTIKDIIVSSIHEYFSQNNYERIEKMFIDTRSNYGFKEKTANPFLEKLVKDCDYSMLQDVVNAAIENLVANNEKILRNIFIDAIANTITDTYGFRDSIRQALREMSR